MNLRIWLGAIIAGAFLTFPTLCVSKTIRCIVFTPEPVEHPLGFQGLSVVYEPPMPTPSGCLNEHVTGPLYKLFDDVYNISTVEESAKPVLDASPQGKDPGSYFPSPSF